MSQKLVAMVVDTFDSSKSHETIQERHRVALENLHTVGQYLIMQSDCPQNVREAWRTLNNYVKNKID